MEINIWIMINNLVNKYILQNFFENRYRHRISCWCVETERWHSRSANSSSRRLSRRANVVVSRSTIWRDTRACTPRFWPRSEAWWCAAWSHQSSRAWSNRSRRTAARSCSHTRGTRAIYARSRTAECPAPPSRLYACAPGLAAVDRLWTRLPVGLSDLDLKKFSNKFLF